jgi:hypothetical protein
MGSSLNRSLWKCLRPPEDKTLAIACYGQPDLAVRAATGHFQCNLGRSNLLFITDIRRYPSGSVRETVTITQPVHAMYAHRFTECLLSGRDDPRLCAGGHLRQGIRAAAFVDRPQNEVVPVLGQILDTVNALTAGCDELTDPR